MSSKHKKPLHEVALAAVLEAKEDQSVGQLISDMKEMRTLFDDHPELSTEYRDFIDALEDAARTEAGHYECSVTTAVPLDEERTKRLIASLEKRLGGTVKLHATVDPSVIGGLSVRSGDWRFPATVKDKLEQLERHLNE